MAGLPFPILGNSTERAWGVTIFHKDSTDFIKEKRADLNHIKRGQEKVKIVSGKVIIKVKDEDDFVFDRYRTKFGPLLRNAFKDERESHDLTISWDYFNEKNNILRGLYIISHAKNQSELEKGVAEIRSPSLNIFQTGIDGNIGHYTTGRLKDYEGQNLIL